MLVGLVSIVALLLLGSYLFTQIQAERSVRNPVNSPSQSPSPRSQNSSDSSLAAAVQTLQEEGATYTHPNGGYTFKYPSEYTLDSEGDNEYIRIYKIGETQTGQTEMYDGVLLVFETIELGNQTLEQWVDTRIQDSTADGMLEVTVPKQSTSLGEYPAFTYTTRGLGEAAYVVAQKDSSSSTAILVSALVSDPASAGFQAEVDAILATLTILK